MKKLFCASLFVVTGIFFFSSCKKEVIQSEIIKEISIDTTIEAGSVFELSLAPVYSSKNTASIIEQASNFTISSINFPEDGSAPTYQYQSNQLAGGTDKVTIAIAAKNTGQSIVSKDSTIIYVNLTIN